MSGSARVIIISFLVCDNNFCELEENGSNS